MFLSGQGLNVTFECFGIRVKISERSQEQVYATLVFSLTDTSYGVSVLNIMIIFCYGPNFEVVTKKSAVHYISTLHMSTTEWGS